MPEHEYPSSRPILSFENWLQLALSGEGTKVEDAVLMGSADPEVRPAYAEYVLWTWENPAEILLARFDLERIAEFLRPGDQIYMDPGLPRSLRNRAWLALGNVFHRIFEPNVGNYLSHRNESAPACKALHEVCYMWWDVSYYYPGSSAAEEDDHRAFLALCSRCLQSPSAAVQESALHGLGHAVSGTKWIEPPVHKMIDAYLSSGKVGRKELVGYARRARRGSVL